MNLVIVESPTKARTIGRFLAGDYAIKASMGHVMDLPKSKLGVDIEHGFTPQYEMVEDKKEIISELKFAAKSADTIILATDPDREGEAIAQHVREILPISNTTNKQIKRIVFHEITKEAIEEALKNPRQIDKNLVDAQTARRVLDRLVGYKLSPLLWQKVRRGLSAGRVQSVALRLIVEREREIEKFGKEKYWTLHVILNSFQDLKSQEKEMLKHPPALAYAEHWRAGVQHDSEKGTEFELIEINNEKIELQSSFQLYDGEYKVTKTTIDGLEKVKKIAQDLKTKEFTVSDVLQKEIKRSPQPPFTTSTLQQEANRRFGFSGKRTMSLAQKLYEEGLITYHRTDSLNVSSQAVFKMRDFIRKEYGGKYLPKDPRFYKTKQKLAQEAHEAIRPTAVGQLLMIKDKVLSTAGQQGWKLYELIWKRAVASQMADSIIESTTVFVDTLSVIPNSFRDLPPAGGSLDDKGEMLKHPPALAYAKHWRAGVQHDNQYRLKANGSVLVFDGFLKVNPLGLSDNRLPKFTAEEKLNLIDVLEKEHETLPPPRYNDASLIKTLEEKGIGRPSTYAAIVSTIEGRQYVEKNEGRFTPTNVGLAVNDFLVKNFSAIDDIPFTASMEDGLDEIANTGKPWQPMIKEFYEPFSKKLEEVKNAERVKIEVEETGQKCPECGGMLVVRIGRFGKFLSCSTFPKCKFTKPFVEKTGLKCPKCGSPADAKAMAGKGGEIVIKKTKRGRKFYGCSNYPACTFAAWKIEDIKQEQPVQKV